MSLFTWVCALVYLSIIMWHSFWFSISLNILYGEHANVSQELKLFLSLKRRHSFMTGYYPKTTHSLHWGWPVCSLLSPSYLVGVDSFWIPHTHAPSHLHHWPTFLRVVTVSITCISIIARKLLPAPPASLIYSVLTPAPVLLLTRVSD